MIILVRLALGGSDLLNDGFDQNPMFVPLTPDEFRFQAGEMMSILDPRLSSVLLKNGRPVGTIVCTPDLNGLLAATRSRIGLLTPFHYLRYRLRRRRAVIIFYSVIEVATGFAPNFTTFLVLRALFGIGKAHQSLGEAL